VFCSDCEGVFNHGGEAWLYPKIATPSGFELLSIFDIHRPVVRDLDFSVYDGGQIPEIECEKLLHFGAGTFYKAAAHTWHIGGAISTITLGPYKEALRKFVRGEANFPNHMVLMVEIAAKPNPFLGVIPPIRMVQKDFCRYVFYISGILYRLAVGKAIPADTHRISFSSKEWKPIFLRDDVSTDVTHIIKSLSVGSKKSKKLEEFLKTKSPVRP